MLDDPEEVFHLKLAELAALGGTRPLPPDRVDALWALVRRRQERRTALATTPLVDPRLLQRPTGDGAALLRGVPGSSGQAEGPVRIIRDGREFGRLQAGEVLVAPYTNPAWTPLFQRAAAVIVDSRAAASHAAIVAREYGIPAVMATGDATQVLRDGQRVLVDGTHGRVLARSELISA